MATALKRMGYNHEQDISVRPGGASIGQIRYLGDVYSGTVKHTGGWEKPYYHESVVGTTITLTREYARQ